ncbi:nudix hydrolase domain containing [Acanthamoeba polyphaga mimivirus]|uniref:Nudix hydrolase domain containing n=4 Tax=Megamimivirinae TaxID=3044648 RepID=A0A2L2DIG2_MIMIV|nr:nudix hydrolase domain containing protein [Megavirus chiliensis]AFX92228.1 nudix hydrolase domain containing protein [Megavirus courdo11]AGD92099.1 nudix hydrolase domain containing protein [Megavirus lba]AVG45930.1 nudix hydrolase domain containing [Acanthamoeba polyphaga mimivirus]AEQ33029.1 NUDIX hydrolase domain-containing protein [Megavirus chiliensis]AVG47033.1 nudix hydrolase domain containing [Acanthamoeba polyphaga mimivirus]
MSGICGVALLDRDNRLCIVKEARSGLWGIPKGKKMNQDISSYDCASRKVRQELLLDINDNDFNCLEIRGLHCNGITIFIAKTNKVYSKIDIRPSRNIMQVHWLPFDFIMIDCAINPKRFNRSVKSLRDFYLDNKSEFIKSTFNIDNSQNIKS